MKNDADGIYISPIDKAINIVDNKKFNGSLKDALLNAYEQSLKDYKCYTVIQVTNNTIKHAINVHCIEVGKGI